MIEGFLEYIKGIATKPIETKNKKTLKIIQCYSFYDTSSILEINNKNNIYSNFKESNSIIISQDDHHLYFIIGFFKTIIIIEQSSITYLDNLFKSKPEIKICFLSRIKEKFDKEMSIQYQEIDSDPTFIDEINNFNKELIIQNVQFKQIWNQIRSCISGFLIKQGYSKLNKNRLDYFLNRNDLMTQIENFKLDDFIELRLLGIGSLFSVRLVYHIEKNELYALKIPRKKDFETPKLIKRENDNYKQLNHPFLPKLIGIIENSGYLVIEFINGKTLDHIKNMHLNDGEKITIIFELCLLFNFIHRYNFVYRDLKPNNIMIDQNKTLVLIDFDRMINTKIDFDKMNLTNDLSSVYLAPEVGTDNISNKCDVYSLGKMIFYIMNESLTKSILNENDDFKNHDKIKDIYLKCIENDPSKRPDIEYIMHNFIIYYGSEIQIKDLYQIMGENLLIQINNYNSFIESKYGIYSIDGVIYMHDVNKGIEYFDMLAHQNDKKAQISLGSYFFDKNVNKSIYYYSLAANNHNDKDSQYIMGRFYYSDKRVRRDINKAIYYFTLSGNQNDAESLFYLGMIYEQSEDIECDMTKAIHYYKRAADLNYPGAQLNLGYIYETGKYVKRDYEKAFYYYSLAAKQNKTKAIFNIGAFYYRGNFVKRDIKKALEYFEKAADQDHILAQYNLGILYYDNKEIPMDINKSIHYLSRAANNNDAKAQYSLGMIYGYSTYVPQNLNNFFYYLTLSANQNNVDAQLNLGLAYISKPPFPQDIQKAIFYLNLAANHNNVFAQYILGILFFENKLIARDMKKATYYLELAAKQNYPDSQTKLGFLYYEGIYVVRDIYKAIHYLSLAADQNVSYSQYLLGEIYYEGEFIERNVNKALHYLSLAANKNYSLALHYLGAIYSKGKYIKCDLNKAFNYYSLGSKLGHPLSSFNLGIYYMLGKHVQQDIEKAIHYFLLSANENFPEAQFNLGLIYSDNRFAYLNMNKAILYFNLAAKNGLYKAHFVLGFLHHQGKYIKRDIKKAISYYKEASSFNFECAKNNLGVIYKNGFGKDIPQQIGAAIEYFEEAIRQKDDVASMYNLAHVYIFDIPNENNIEKAVNLLIRSSNKGLSSSIELLCLLLIKKFGLNLEKIRKEIDKYSNETHDLYSNVVKIIQYQNLSIFSNFEILYQSYIHVNLLYDNLNRFIVSSSLFANENDQIHNKLENISSYFYEGFGIDL